MGDAATQPLVVTLALATGDKAWFEAARRRHFPAARNQVPAHVSLFHALPGDHAAAVTECVAREASSCTAFAVQVRSVRLYGSGVGYELEATALSALHAQLRSVWLPWLTAQDRQGFRPHILVQNKVPAEEAHALLSHLQSGFAPWTILATGITLWRYEGGPWSRVETFAFQAGSEKRPA